ncbi:MAG: siderophore ABC transporter substrate-binding protein [Litoreibacter sp.]
MMIKYLGVMCALLTAPVFAKDVQIETYSGSVAVASKPETIAVFDLAALDSLEALGIAVDGVVTPAYLSYLEDAVEGTFSVGSLFEPDFEALNALQPDLIIAGGRSSKQVPELTKFAPTVDMTIWEDTVGQGLARLHAYGEIFDKEAEANALRTEFEAKLTTLKAASADTGSALILMTNGPKVSAYGAAGRFGWLHQVLGLPETVDEVEQSTHGEAISFEFIKDANPDVLLVIDRLAAIGTEGENAKTTLDNALVRETTAWKTGNIIYLSSAPIYIAGGGIQSMNITLDELLAVFSGS